MKEPETRPELLYLARTMLGDSPRFDSMDDHEIRVELVLARYPHFDLADKPPAYVGGCLKAICDSADFGVAGTVATARAIRHEAPDEETRARQRMLQGYKEARVAVDRAVVALAHEAADYVGGAQHVREALSDREDEPKRKPWRWVLEAAARGIS